MRWRLARLWWRTNLIRSRLDRWAVHHLIERELSEADRMAPGDERDAALEHVARMRRLHASLTQLIKHLSRKG